MFNYKKIRPNDLWYLVGLVTTDGCLSKDERHIIITSKNLEFLRDLKNRLKINNIIGRKRRGKDGYNDNKWYYHIQISNKEFYNFLLSLGLSARKSLSLGALKIPNKYFSDCLRGIIDGDGSICSWYHPQNKCKQWSLRIYSGSERFLEWLEQKIILSFSAAGKLHHTKCRNTMMYVLKFGKIAAIKILNNCYYHKAFSLKQKLILAKQCVSS